MLRLLSNVLIRLAKEAADHSMFVYAPSIAYYFTVAA